MTESVKSLVPSYGKKDRLILFTRHPVPGRVKTRLIPALGPEGACRLHRRMTEDTLLLLRECVARLSLSLEVRFDGGDIPLMKAWLGSDLILRDQGQGDLGIRLELAFQEAFQAGNKRVVIVGSDCPGLTLEILQKAFTGLDADPLVLGPARDGGYYLIGLSRPQSRLFLDIPWGTAEVFNRTMEIANRLGMKPLILETLDDIDRPEDLIILKKFNDFPRKPF